MLKKNYYSSFWLDLDSYDEYDQIIKLSIIQKTITNFVNILTNGKQINCIFSEKPNNTKNSKETKIKTAVSTEDTIIISADLDNVDLVVGLALHEATHLVRSDFNYQTKLPIEIIQYVINLNIEQKIIFDNLFQVLVNFIEDRSIDYEQQIASPGYSGYYQVIFDECFNNKNITNQLNNPGSQVEHINNYIFRIINILNPNANKFSLFGLEKIYDVIDLDNIGRLKTTKESVDIAWQIYKILLEYCDVFQFKLAEDEVSDIIKDQSKYITHQYNKKKLNSSTKREVDNISKTNLKKKSCTFNTKEITTYVFEDYHFDKIEISGRINQKNLKAISEGLVLSNKLKEKLQIRNTIKETVYNRKQTGKIDKKRLFSFNYDDHGFYTKQIETHGDAYIHLSIDTSSSMSFYWDKVIIILVSLLKSFQSFPDIKVVVSFRTSMNFKDNLFPVVYLVYDSTKSNIETFFKFLKYFNPSGLTPDGLCYNAILNSIEKESRGKNSYFVNLSDGLPWMKSDNFIYAGIEAEEHTRKEVNKIKKVGCQVLSFFVGDEENIIESRFKYIYGKNSTFIYQLNDPKKIINAVNSLFC